MSPPAIPGLIEPPRFIVGTCLAEIWETGRSANKRVRALRGALGDKRVSTSTILVTRRRSADLGDERVSVAAVEITYSDPDGRAPAVGEKATSAIRRNQQAPSVDEPSMPPLISRAS